MLSYPGERDFKKGSQYDSILILLELKRTMEKGERDKKSLDDNRPLLEDQWVKRVREHGDRCAFKKIFQAYYKRLHGYARSYVCEMQEAEDIVQSVFLSIWAQRQSWNPPGSLKSYLFIAVKNEALNVIRHQKVVNNAEEEIARKFNELKETKYNTSDTDLEKLRNEIEQGIEQLPPRCRQIFVLNRRSGLTYTEIADVLELSIGTINTQMGRALKKLRNHLSDYLTVVSICSLSHLIANLLV